MSPLLPGVTIEVRVSDSERDCLAHAIEIFQKIDTKGAGFIDRQMMHDYCQRVLDFACPGKPVDKVALENGFQTLDSNGDGLITLEDIKRFAISQRSATLQMPVSFMRYAQSSTK